MSDPSLGSGAIGTGDGPGTGASTSPANGPSGGGISSWSKNKKIAVGGGVFVAAAVGVFLYARHKSSSTSTGTGATQTVAIPNNNGAAFGSSGQYQNIQQLESQIAALTAALNGTGTGGTSTGTGAINPGGPPIALQPTGPSYVEPDGSVYYPSSGPPASSLEGTSYSNYAEELGQYGAYTGTPEPTV